MVWRRGRVGTVCARGAHRAPLRGPSTSPLDAVNANATHRAPCRYNVIPLHLGCKRHRRGILAPKVDSLAQGSASGDLGSDCCLTRCIHADRYTHDLIKPMVRLLRDENSASDDPEVLSVARSLRRANITLIGCVLLIVALLLASRLKLL